MASPCARNWCFTDFDLQEVEKWARKGLHDPTGMVVQQAAVEVLHATKTVSFVVMQLERTQEDRLHYQGYVQLPRKQRLTWLRRHVLEKAHWEVARGTANDNIAYCTKEDSREAGPWRCGDVKHQGVENSFDECVEAVKEGMPLHEAAEAWPGVWVKHSRGLCDLRQRLQLKRDRRAFGPEGPEVWVLYGSSGTGKSRFVAEHWPDAFWKIPGEKWWDGYEEHETVVLDDFKVGELRLTDLQRLLDWNPLWVEVKGGAVPMLAKRYVITSNYHPSEWYPKADVHGTIMRRVHDFAEAHGRLVCTDLPDWKSANAPKSVGNTSTTDVAVAPSDEEIRMENAWMELCERVGHHELPEPRDSEVGRSETEGLEDDEGNAAQSS